MSLSDCRASGTPRPIETALMARVLPIAWRLPCNRLSAKDGVEGGRSCWRSLNGSASAALHGPSLQGPTHFAARTLIL